MTHAYKSGNRFGFSQRAVGYVAIALVVVLVAVGIGAWVMSRLGRTTVTAYFDRAVGIYSGSDVRVLGVTVGKVTNVTPDGTKVRVTLQVDRGVPLPADLWAAQVTPSVVSDRYVQLLPPYTGGAQARTGAVIEEEKTMTPVEIDEVYKSISDLSKALGPDGANSSGALTRAVNVGAKNLAGNGQALADSITQLSRAATTLSNSRGNIAATVKGLNTFVGMLAENDSDVRTFNSQLASLTQFLARESADIEKAVKLLSGALGDVASFVRDNRDALADNVNGLVEVTKVLADTRQAQAQILTYLPLAAGNIGNSYDGDTGTLGLRLVLPQLQDPLGAICDLLDLGKLAPGHPGFTQLSVTLGPIISQCKNITGQITKGITTPTLNLPFGILSGANQQRRPTTSPSGTSAPSVDGVLPSTPAGKSTPPATSTPAPTSAGRTSTGRTSTGPSSPRSTATGGNR